MYSRSRTTCSLASTCDRVASISMVWIGRLLQLRAWADGPGFGWCFQLPPPAAVESRVHGEGGAARLRSEPDLRRRLERPR